MKISLIGGSGRSGTTILSKIFSMHPQFVNVPEWRFLIDPDGIIDFYCSYENWSPYHFDLKLKRLEKLLYQTSSSNIFEKLIRYFDQFLIKYSGNNLKLSPRYTGISVLDFSPNYLILVNQLIDELRDFEYYGEWVGLSGGYTRNLSYSSTMDRREINLILRKFLLSVMSDVTKHQSKINYLEKNTWNILWFDKIQELLPESKMVHVYRDPRDVVTSFAQQTWMPSDIIKSAKVYRDLLNRWEKVKTRVKPETYMEISLESLVKDPISITKDICYFWGVDWSKELLDIDLSKSNSGRWKNELSLAEIDAIESILDEPLHNLGYRK